MRSWRSIVHLCAWSCSIMITFIHHIECILRASNVSLCQIRNKYSSFRILLNNQSVFGWIEKVLYIFKINFEHWNFESKLDIIATTFYLIENCLNHSWNNSLQLRISDIISLHRICLSWSCLAISKDCSVKAIQNTFSLGDLTFNYWSGSKFIYWNLLWVHVEYFIKVKCVGFALSTFLHYTAWHIYWFINSRSFHMWSDFDSLFIWEINTNLFTAS